MAFPVAKVSLLEFFEFCGVHPREPNIDTTKTHYTVQSGIRQTTETELQSFHSALLNCGISESSFVLLLREESPGVFVKLVSYPSTVRVASEPKWTERLINTTYSYPGPLPTRLQNHGLGGLGMGWLPPGVYAGVGCDEA